MSPNNPCPVLRALVESGHLAGHVEKLSTIADMIVAISDGGPSDPPMPYDVTHLIAMIANGLAPDRLDRSLRVGAELDALRGGPLDKKGAGSRILDAAGAIDEAQLARLDSFASDKTDGSGMTERGLNLGEIVTMMDANFARAEGTRGPIDRALMNAEWPALLKVMGKGTAAERYLSVAEVRTLFVELRLPPRIMERLEPA